MPYEKSGRMGASPVRPFCLNRKDQRTNHHRSPHVTAPQDADHPQQGVGDFQGTFPVNSFYKGHQSLDPLKVDDRIRSVIVDRDSFRQKPRKDPWGKI